MPSLVACAFWPHPVPALLPYAEAVARFTPLIALRKSEAVFLDLSASRHLMRSETIALKLDAIARRMGLPSPRVALGGRAALALAAARFGEPARWPLEALRDLADPFGAWNADESAWATEALALLRGLGLTHAQDLARLPADAIGGRLGARGLQLRRALDADAVDPAWPIHHPAEVVSETLDLLDAESLDSRGADLEALLFFAKRAIDRCLARLRARGLRLAGFSLRLDLERGEAREWDVELAIAQGSAAAVLPIVRERLAWELARTPLEATGTRLRCEVRETAPGHGAQRDFFHAKEEKREARDAFFARAAARLGAERVFVAAEADCHAPERAWRRVAPEEKPGAGVARKPRRPLRLLDPPQRVRELGNFLQLPSGKRHAIARKTGPERLQALWWEPQPLRRDYYEIVTTDGARLWVFKEREGDFIALYLHGYFD